MNTWTHVPDSPAAFVDWHEEEWQPADSDGGYLAVLHEGQWEVWFLVAGPDHGIVHEEEVGTYSLRAKAHAAAAAHHRRVVANDRRWEEAMTRWDR